MIWTASALVAVGVMLTAFLVARRLGRYDLVDAAWGLAFIGVALTSFWLQPGERWQLDGQSAVTALVVIWGSRLSWHILRRFRRSRREDERYVELRRRWRGSVALNALVRVYLLQAALVVVVSLPVGLINQADEVGLDWWLGLVLLIWLVGFSFEAVADRQLRRFLAGPSNRGQLMTAGLWRYSRHPNYFGELAQWWAIGLAALSVPYGYLGLVGPALLSYLIIFVSGVAISEKRFAGRPGWADYRRRTSVLLPLPPKKV